MASHLYLFIIVRESLAGQEACTRPAALTMLNPRAHRSETSCGLGKEGYNRTGLE